MPQDMRQQARFPVRSNVFVELASPDFGSNSSSTLLRCQTLEISRSGLRIGLHQELLVGAILQVAVELPRDNRTLILVAEVAWSRPVPGTGNEHAWSAGLVLLDADDSDIDSWVALVTMMEG
jgi:hypothetical protein